MSSQPPRRPPAPPQSTQAPPAAPGKAPPAALAKAPSGKEPAVTPGKAPASPARAQTPARTPPQASAAAASAVRRLLLVSDDPVVRQAVAQEFTLGYELHHVALYAAAAWQLEADRNFAVVLVDLDMGDRQGAADFLATLVDKGFPAPRLLLSSSFSRTHAATYSQSCVVHLALASPWAPGELRATLEAALAPT